MLNPYECCSFNQCSSRNCLKNCNCGGIFLMEDIDYEAMRKAPNLYQNNNFDSCYSYTTYTTLSYETKEDYLMYSYACLEVILDYFHSIETIKKNMFITSDNLNNIDKHIINECKVINFYNKKILSLLHISNMYKKYYIS